MPGRRPGLPWRGRVPCSAAFSAVASRICNTSRVPERIGPTALRVPTHLHPVCTGFRPFPDLLCRFCAFYGQIRPDSLPVLQNCGPVQADLAAYRSPRARRPTQPVVRPVDRLIVRVVVRVVDRQDEGTAARQNHWAPALRRRMGASTSVSAGKSVIAAAASALSGLTPGSGQIEHRERSSPPLAAFAVSTSAVIAPQSGSLSQAGEPPPQRSGRSIARRLGRKSHPPTIRGEKRAFFCTNAWLTAASSRPVGRSAGFVGLSGATRAFPVGRSGHYY